MKRTFLAKRNALLSSTNVSWGALALTFSTFLLLVRLLAPDFFWYVLTPVFRVSDTFAESSHRFFSSFNNRTALVLENERLVNENAALALENQTLLQKESSIAGLAGNDQKGITAGVVARPPASPYDTLLIAAGEEQGVALGMEAFGEGGTPLGIVSSIHRNFSRITLFSSSNASTDGWVGKENLPLSIKGAGGGALYASVSRSAGIAVGDSVSVPGPGSLPIGVVVRIDSDPASPSVTLRIVPALNLFSTTWVQVRDTGMTAFTLATSTFP